STNIASGNKNATKLIAKPGHSEHQLGIAVDFTSPSIGNVSATGKFGDTLESKWLEENASKYGFILSYPKGKEEITGYLYEPWHYRYVGIEHAIEIANSGKTGNEYFKEIKESDINKKSAL
ncbi:MAG: M15 family metallopeptidase, partial [Patescibacteria group bacterium]